MNNNGENNNQNGSLPPRNTRFNFSNNRLTSAPPSQRDLPAHERAIPAQPHLTGRKQQHTDKTGPLVFNVASLLRDFEGAHRDYDFEQDVLPMGLEEGEKPVQATNITGHIRFTKIRGSILTQGQGEADVVLECVRCLNDFEYHVIYDIEETFRPLIDITTGYPVKTESLEEESDLKLDANHLLNLGEAIRQQILVSLPINPVCGDDCPGFSSILERVNATDSEAEDATPAEEEEAEPEVIDKRWAALSKLLENEPEK
ncbi:MAG: DUF177 domain-containing protein [Chloroflexi bacterium]|nr:DUF177 domain-containing protein [Chloroflexota bacterium]OJV89224.1 MAG: hypothetical protein BGO39_35075 [Chloroflexi bacterium 54-19]